MEIYIKCFNLISIINNKIFKITYKKHNHFEIPKQKIQVVNTNIKLDKMTVEIVIEEAWII